MTNPVAVQHAPSLRFVCKACRTSLVVPESQTGVSGPCPNCATWIDASEFSMQDSPSKTLAANVSPQRQSSKTHRRSIRADGYLDHDHTERKELYGTLKVLAVTLAVMAVILFVILYMNQWMGS